MKDMSLADVANQEKARADRAESEVARLTAALDRGRGEPPTCPCCLGDPLTVCSACLRHDCWAGNFMCEDARSAGTVQLDAKVLELVAELGRLRAPTPSTTNLPRWPSARTVEDALLLGDSTPYSAAQITLSAELLHLRAQVAVMHRVFLAASAYIDSGEDYGSAEYGHLLTMVGTIEPVSVDEHTARLLMLMDKAGAWRLAPIGQDDREVEELVEAIDALPGGAR